jgi:hypothetical protein
MAFNRLQRTVSGLSVGTKVTVVPLVVDGDANMNLSSLRLEVDLLSKVKADLKEDELIEECIKKEAFAGQLFCARQEFCVDFKGCNIKLTVLGLEVAHLADKSGGADDEKTSECGFVMSMTEISVEAVSQVASFGGFL